MTSNNELLDTEIINAMRDALNGTPSSAATVSVAAPILRAALSRLIDATSSSGGTRSYGSALPAVSLWTKAEIMAEQSPGTAEMLVKLRIHTANLWAADQQKGDDTDVSPWYTMTTGLSDDFISQFAGALKQIKAWKQQDARHRPT